MCGKVGWMLFLLAGIFGLEWEINSSAVMAKVTVAPPPSHAHSYRYTG